jgi:hypothetical protein
MFYVLRLAQRRGTSSVQHLGEKQNIDLVERRKAEVRSEGRASKDGIPVRV